MKDKIIQRVLAVFAVILAVLIFVTITATQNIQRSMASSDWVNHTHAVIMEADAILGSLHAGDGAMRTFLLTGEPRDKVASREAFAAMSEHFEVTKALTSQDAAQAGKMSRLQELLNDRMQFTRAVVAARDANDQENVRRLVAKDAGDEVVREITRLIEKLKGEQKALLTERDNTSYLQAHTTRWTVLTGLAINFLLLTGAAWLVRDDIAARQRAAIVLEEANATLEAKVKERTAELVTANAKLVAENQERRWGNQSLEHQLRYNQLIINSISDLVVVLTKMCNVTRVNPAVTQRTGWSAAELISKPMTRIVRLTSPGAPDLLRQTLKAGRELQEQPAEILAQDGSATPARLSMFPLRDRDKVVGAVVTIRVTPRQT